MSLLLKIAYRYLRKYLPKISWKCKEILRGTSLIQFSSVFLFIGSRCQRKCPVNFILFVCSSVRPPVLLFVHPFICSSIRSSVRPSVHLFVHPFFCSSIRSSVRPSVRLFVHPFFCSSICSSILSQHKISESAYQFFLFFRMNLVIKQKSDEARFLKKKSQRFRRVEKVRQMAQK